MHLPKREDPSTYLPRPLGTVARIQPAELWKSTTALPGWTRASQAARASSSRESSEHGQRVVELRERAGADDRCGHPRLILHPEERELRGAEPAVTRQLGERRRDGEPGFGDPVAGLRDAARRASPRGTGRPSRTGRSALPRRAVTTAARPARSRSHAGSSSFSMRRSSRLYGGCSLTNAGRSRSRAIASSSTTIHAANVDEPIHRTLPASTSSPSTPSVSSSGTTVDGRCNW